MPPSETDELFLAAADAVYRAHGTVANAQVSVDERRNSFIGEDRYGVFHRDDRREYRVDFTVYLIDHPTDLRLPQGGFCTCALHPQPAAPAPVPVTRDAALRALGIPRMPRRIVAAFDDGTVLNYDFPTDRPTVGQVASSPLTTGRPGQPAVTPEEHVHDADCTRPRHLPRTPGRSGCSCSAIPGEAPAPPPATSEPAQQPVDDTAVRFSMLEPY